MDSWLACWSVTQERFLGLWRDSLIESPDPPPGHNSSYLLVICELFPWVIRQLSISYLPDIFQLSVSYPAAIHELYANAL